MYLPDNSIALNADTQSRITPEAALEMLKKGNQRFLDGKPLNRDLHSQVKQTTGGQYPFAVILSCIDSRVPAETVFDQGIGDIFSVRVAGNFINPDVLGSIEYSCKVAGSKLVVILGHTACGAVKGACDDVKLGNITQMLDKLKPAVDAVETPDGTDRSSSNSDFVNKVVSRNVELSIDRLLAESPVLHDMKEAGEIEVVGAVYDVKDGKVTFM